ncbi:MAG: hypothetical protein H6602_07520 [Flavobacteriales bacterium]|nr:hypothetical protein [Flavobacteriales bacterium]
MGLGLDNDGQFDDASDKSLVISSIQQELSWLVSELRPVIMNWPNHHVVTINPMPIASFAATDICLGDQTTLSSTSTTN